ncbi:MarR family winged helix-turn-helix transcriptional regulator [Caulobacter sp. KR2-114]|uniref:MarR family winged helix-turn-helix transcriptional regulator n=1 Tax=Caulobacter sp. KR2-114 TaxID=3400912 RepID=UPI003C0AA1A2
MNAHTPDTAALDDFPLGARAYLFYLIFQIGQQRQSAIEADLEPLGLNFAKWRSLAFIQRLGSCSMKSLARLSGVHRTTLTRSIDRLVEDGLVSRAGLEADRRKVMLSLTEAGVEAFRAAEAVQRQFTDHVLQDVPEKVQRDLCRRLALVLRGMIPEPDLADDILAFDAPRRDIG